MRYIEKVLKIYSNTIKTKTPVNTEVYLVPGAGIEPARP